MSDSWCHQHRQNIRDTRTCISADGRPHYTVAVDGYLGIWHTTRTICRILSGSVARLSSDTNGCADLPWETTTNEAPLLAKVKRGPDTIYLSIHLRKRLPPSSLRASLILSSSISPDSREKREGRRESCGRGIETALKFDDDDEQGKKKSDQISS